MSLKLVPCSVQDAREYVRQFHRHRDVPLSGLFAVACAKERVCGVAIVGRPVARMMDDDWTAEVTRVATDGNSERLFDALFRLLAYCPGSWISKADYLYAHHRKWGIIAGGWLEDCRRGEGRIVAS